MKRTLAVRIDEATWLRPMPSELPAGSTRYNIDLNEAFLMLGTLTMPQLLSRASPARFWAWLRYFLSISITDDLRITMDFADLDPHQKSILSDDFGVALSTLYLHNKFGGVAPIVDGRRFMIQFARLLRRRAKPPKAKVGPSKAPDFVFRDQFGRWHVLECKGTQSGHGARDHFLKMALSQKQVIQIGGRVRGERLAAGLSISNEKDSYCSELRIIDPDPEPEPLLILGDQQAAEMNRSAHRISIARAMGLIGLNDAAIELSLPSDLTNAEAFLRPSEKVRVQTSREERAGHASGTIRNRNLLMMEYHHQKYEGRRGQFGYEELGQDSGFREISVRQGVNHDFLQEIASTSLLREDELDDRIKTRVAHAQISFETEGDRTVLSYGDILFAELILRT